MPVLSYFSQGEVKYSQFQSRTSKVHSANRELGTMNKEMEISDQLSLVLYVLVVQEILISLHLGPNREAYTIQKGRTRFC